MYTSKEIEGLFSRAHTNCKVATNNSWGTPKFQVRGNAPLEYINSPNKAACAISGADGTILTISRIRLMDMDALITKLIAPKSLSHRIDIDLKEKKYSYQLAGVTHIRSVYGGRDTIEPNKILIVYKEDIDLILKSVVYPDSGISILIYLVGGQLDLAKETLCTVGIKGDRKSVV